MSDRRTVASAHERADAIEKELIELQTTVRIQLKDIYGRIKLSQNILLTASGSIIVMLVTIITRMGQVMDPITILSGLSAGIKAGKQLYSLKNQVVDFFDTVDEAKAKHAKKKNSIFAGSNEAGLSTYLDMMAARDAEEQLRELIVNTRGLSAYTELQNIRKEIRQERKAAEAQRQIDRQKRAEAALTVAVIVLGAIALFGGLYGLGLYLGWFSF